MSKLSFLRAVESVCRHCLTDQTALKSAELFEWSGCCEGNVSYQGWHLTISAVHVCFVYGEHLNLSHV